MEVDQPSDFVFTCADPLDRPIAARQRRWEDHIRARHPEIAPRIEAVRATLEAPDFIVSDFDNPDGLNYYRLAVLPSPYDRLYLKVVVSCRRIGSSVIGDVITAYPTGQIARGEVHRWP
ncbi:MAG: hypothetical protein ACREX8_20035 [Gammaproteobacteria bacterium]